MRTYQELSESIFGLYNIKGQHGDTAVHKNPDKPELTAFKQVRSDGIMNGILMPKGGVYVWIEDSDHKRIANILKREMESVNPIFIKIHAKKSPITVQVLNDVKNAKEIIVNHKQIKKIFGTVNVSDANNVILERNIMLEKEILDKPTPSVEDIAKKHDVDVTVIMKQLKMGTKMEKEHTSDPKIAREIALDHINEHPDYYTKLAKMEAE